MIPTNHDNWFAGVTAAGYNQLFMQPLVELIGVSKTFGGTIALHPTDLAFQPGLTTALIGPSGCGKSTLLRLIIGLLWPETRSRSCSISNE